MHRHSVTSDAVVLLAKEGADNVPTSPNSSGTTPVPESLWAWCCQMTMFVAITTEGIFSKSTLLVISPLSQLHLSINNHSEPLFQIKQIISLKLHSNWTMFWWQYGFVEILWNFPMQRNLNNKKLYQFKPLIHKPIVYKLTFLKSKMCNSLTIYLLEILSHFPCHATEKMERIEQKTQNGFAQNWSFIKNIFSWETVDH